MPQVSYRFRLYPNRTQEKQLAVYFGQVRFVWNHCLALRSDLYECRQESINYVGLNKHLTYLKTTGKFGWLKECPAQALTQTLIDQDKAFKNFFEKRGKYPRFKKKHHAQSMRFQLDQRHILDNYKAGERLKLPKLGAVKVNWSRIPAGTPKMATVSQDPSGKYWIAFSCEQSIQPKAKTKLSVGVDVGIKDVAVTSDGYHSGAPKHTYRYARKLKIAQRQLARKRKGSKRYHKQRQAVARIHATLANSRKDFLHKLTSMLVTQYDVISVEDLNVKGMLANRKLAKAVADVGMYEFSRQLAYKCQWYGKHLQTIDRWFPSTKLCSQCGQLHSMPLSTRWLSCDCGNEMDRDENAAKNIQAEGNRLLNYVEPETHRAGSNATARQAMKRSPNTKRKAVSGTQQAA